MGLPYTRTVGHGKTVFLVSVPCNQIVPRLMQRVAPIARPPVSVRLALQALTACCKKRLIAAHPEAQQQFWIVAPSNTAPVEIALTLAMCQMVISRLLWLHRKLEDRLQPTSMPTRGFSVATLRVATKTACLAAAIQKAGL